MTSETMRAVDDRETDRERHEDDDDDAREAKRRKIARADGATEETTTKTVETKEETKETKDAKVEDTARENETTTKSTSEEKPTASGFGSALAGSGFGGLKSGGVFGGVGGGGFGGFAAANTGGGFASKAIATASAPVALFGAGKKTEAEDDEEGEDDPEREVANDSIKPVVELGIIETKNGEEDETCAFRTEGALFEFVTDDEGSRWLDRGRGDVRLNEGENGSRIIMRAKGNYRLMLNAALFKGQTFKLMEGGKGVSFSCKNAAAGAVAKMSTFALKMRAAASNAQSQAEGFHVAATKAIEKLSDENK